MGTATEHDHEMTEAQKLDEILDTMRRVDALLTEFEPQLRALANNPVARFAMARRPKGTR